VASLKCTATVITIAGYRAFRAPVHYNLVGCTPLKLLSPRPVRHAYANRGPLVHTLDTLFLFVLK